MIQYAAIRACLALGVIALGACQTTVPDSGPGGVGFADYNGYEQSRVNRDTALQRGESVFPGGAIGDDRRIANAATPPRPVISGEDLRAAGLPGGGGFGAPVTATTPGTTTPLLDGAIPLTGSTIPNTNNPSISDEQDFGAVSERQTIESDAQRLARQSAAYEVVQPTAVPTRPGASAPNIVAYALSTSNPLGQRVHDRSGFNADSRFLRACASYSSSDKAQEDFLRNGGPQKDSRGVDPDGDGFACYWDPTPFRKVSGN